MLTSRVHVNRLMLLFLICILWNSELSAQLSSQVEKKMISSKPFLYAGDKRVSIDGLIPLDSTVLRPIPATIFGGVFTVAVGGLYINQKSNWWSNERRSFHFEEDWVSALQVDKFGHAFGGYSTAYLMREGLLYSGLSDEHAHWYGALFGLAYQTYVETGDGFATDWGFSPSDFYYDAIGAGYFLAQYYIPSLQNFTPKWQYIPSELVGRPKIDRPRTFLDDYNSTTFFMSIDVYNLLPKEYKKYWVPWLALAVGFGGDAIDFKLDPNGPPDQLSKRRYVLSLDVNLTRLIPDGPPLVNWVRQCFNHIKVPTPSVEFTSSGAKFYLLYPIKIVL